MMNKDLISKANMSGNVEEERKRASDNEFDSASDGADGSSISLMDDELDSVSGRGCGGTTRISVPERKRKRIY